MRPLGTRLTHFADFESDLRAGLSDGHVIGFLLDSRMGDLNKSGLISHPKAVIPLDELLGNRATLFYPDPRRFEGRAYSEAVRDFGQSLLGSEHVRYQVSTPALLLMTYHEGLFQRTAVLSLDSLPMCLWHAQVYGFVEEYLKSASLDRPTGEGWTSVIKSHAGTIGVESLKVCVGVLINKLMPL